MTEQIGFAIEGPRQSVDPIILFCAKSEPSSAKALARLHTRFPGATLVPVYNDGMVRGLNLRNDFAATSETVLPLRMLAMSPLLRANRRYQAVLVRRFPPSPARRGSLQLPSPG